MSEYKISAVLEGHGDDVRMVAFPHRDTVLSASRDATVRVWKLTSASPPSYDYAIAVHGQSAVNALAYVPPKPEYPEGLILSGGREAIIEARQPGKQPNDNAEALLLGHEGNICSLDVCAEGNWIVSGSWDCSARVWQLGKWEGSIELEGHQASVWAVLAYDKNTIITGSADKGIRIFNPSGKLLKSITCPDIVRALCKLPAQHTSGAQFASASNDGVIRLLTLDGRQVAELYGHESFIYSLATLPTGEIVSSGEDRTVRIWNGTECVQTITHPAISVWSVAVSQETGDIATGASDRIARVFSRSKERQGDAVVIQQFDEAVKSSSIPQEQVGPSINKEKLPGPEFLTQKSGTKDGQVQMIKESNGNVTAHQWSVAQSSWIAIGTVVDSAGSSGRKTEYLGQDYDFVFDVDIEDGKPPLKLPYNLAQNPYEAATKFLQDNEMPMSYLDQVASFITTNTQGASIGQSSGRAAAAAGADPWGQESRYRPGDVPETSQQLSAPPTASRPKVLPQKDYLFITTANLKTVHKKIGELNDQLVSSGSKDLSFSPSDLDILGKVCNQLDNATSIPIPETPYLQPGIKVALKIATAWPATHRLPGLDLIRLLTAATPLITSSDFHGQSQDLITILASTGVFDSSSNPNNAMLATRAIANLFATPEGRDLVSAQFDQIFSLVQNVATTTTNRNLSIAATTLYINLAVYFTSPEQAQASETEDRALELLGQLDRTLRAATDSEVIYRALVAIGTLVTGLSDDVRLAATGVYEIERVFAEVESSKSAGKEPRVKGVIGEVRAVLKD